MNHSYKKTKHVFLFVLFIILANTARSQVMERLGLSNMDTVAVMERVLKSQYLIEPFPDSARAIYEEALVECLNYGYGRGLRNVYIQLARVDIQKKAYNQAVKNIYLMFRYCDSTKHYDALALGYFLLGYILQEQEHYNQSFEAYSKALSYPTGTLSIVCHAYCNIADMLSRMGEDNKAIQYLDMAIREPDHKHKKEVIGGIYTNKAKLLAGMGKLKMSEAVFDSAIAVSRENLEYNNLFEALIFKGDLYDKLNEPGKALGLIAEARRVRQQCRAEPKRVYLADMIAGDAYMKQKRYTEAEKYLLMAKAYEADLNNVDKAYIFYQLSKMYQAMGNFKNAYHYQEQAYLLRDSTRSKDIALKVNEMEIRYRTTEKDKKITSQQLLISDSQKRIAQKNNIILSIALVSAVLILLGTWRFTYLRRKQVHEKEIARLKGTIEGEEKERSRLAHDLHDGINSQLSAVHAFLLAEENLHPFLATSRNFITAQNLLQQTTTGVRSIAHNLAPEILLLKGLATTIKEYCRDVFANGQIRADINVYGDFSDVSTSLSLNLYRIIQELTQNILKHSGATEVIVLLYRKEEEGQIILVVEDNGKGMPEPLTKGKDRNGIGLTGLEERVKLYRGTLAVDTGAGKGTAIHITIPTDIYSPDKAQHMI
jgi:signal transduction histidine kinase